MHSESEDEEKKTQPKGARKLSPKKTGGKKELDQLLDNSDHTDATEEE